jgi:hypothetical protein
MKFSSNSSVAGESEDGVWTGQNTHGRKGGRSEGSDQPGKRAPSVASSAVSANTTGTAWDQIMNVGRAEQSYRSRIGSASTSVTSTQTAKQSGNWAKQGAVKADRSQLLLAEKNREAQRKIQEQERARFQEEASDESDWEL